MNIQTIREANKRARDKDESHLYPINGRFNATERAIRRLRRQYREAGYWPDDYEAALQSEISAIVNSEV